MPTLHQISVRLTIGSLALNEFCDSTPNPEPNTVSAYTLTWPNLPFLVAIHVPRTVEFLSDVLLVRVFKDGKFMEEEWCSPPRNPPETKDDKAVDHWIGAEELRFPHVVADSNNNAPGDVEAWKASEVVVQISHARVVEPPGVDGFGNKTKGRVQLLEGIDHVLAFTFKYRPEAVLRSILLKPPPAPNPTSSSEHPADTAFKAQATSKNTNNPEIYCSCRRIRPDQPMVTCDNDRCEIKTYHLDCVGETSEPTKGATWLCPRCMKLSAREVRIGGDTQEFGPFQEEWIGDPHWF